MWRAFGAVVVVVVCGTLSIRGTPARSGPAGAGWELAWHAEFNGASGTRLDQDKWTYDIGNNYGWGNNE